MTYIQKRLNNEIFNTVFEDLKGYEGLYKISRNGEIWSNCYERMLIPIIDELGYAKTRLTDSNHTPKKCSIHRLLAIQFIPNPDDKPFIDHIDRNPSNNSLSNLRWATHTENMNNKKDNIALLTPAEMEQRKIDLRTYHREFAEKQRRAAGVQIKSEMTKSKQPDYNKEKQREWIAKKTEEEKEELREHKRELYHKNGRNEHQREYVSRPEVHQKRMEDQTKRRAEMTDEQREKINEKAKEYYEKNKEANRIKAKAYQANKSPEQKEKDAKRRKELYDAKKQAKLTSI